MKKIAVRPLLEFIDRERVCAQFDERFGQPLTSTGVIDKIRRYVEELATAKPEKARSKEFDREALRTKANGSDTSVAAAHSIAGVRLTMIHKLWLELADSPATCHELCSRTGSPIQTVSARLNDLAELGYIEDTGQRRLTSKRRGTTAVVWRAVMPDEQLEAAE